MTARQEASYRKRLHAALEAAAAESGNAAAYARCVAKVTGILDEIGRLGWSVSLVFGPDGARSYAFRPVLSSKEDPFEVCDLALAAVQKALRDVPVACLGQTNASIVRGGLDSAGMLLDWTRRHLAFARDVEAVENRRKKR